MEDRWQMVVGFIFDVKIRLASRGNSGQEIPGNDYGERGRSGSIYSMCVLYSEFKPDTNQELQRTHRFAYARIPEIGCRRALLRSVRYRGYG